MPQMSFGREGRVIVTMHTATSPNADEWTAYLALIQGVVDTLDEHPISPTSLVFTDGAAPSADQRRTFIDVVGNRSFRSAIVTTSRFTRGIVTALSWFTPGVRAFAPDDADGILHHAGIGSYELPSVLAMSSSLSTQIGGVIVYDRFVAAMNERHHRTSA